MNIFIFTFRAINTDNQTTEYGRKEVPIEVPLGKHIFWVLREGCLILGSIEICKIQANVFSCDIHAIILAHIVQERTDAPATLY